MFWVGLSPDRVDFFAVGGHDVNFVGMEIGVEEFPDDFFVAGDLEDAGFGGVLLRVGTDDDVSVGHALCAAGVLEAVAVNLGVVGVPDHFSVGIEFSDFVSVGEVGVDVAVGKHDSGEGPVVDFAAAELFEVGWDGADDFAFGRVFFYLEGEKVGHEVVSVFEFARHAGLHVEIVGFGLKGDFDFDFTFFGDFEDAGVWAEFGEHGVSVFETNGGAHFLVFVGEVVFPDDVGSAFFVFPGVFCGGDDDIAVVEHVTVTAGPAHFPCDFAVFVEEVGELVGAGDEE